MSKFQINAISRFGKLTVFVILVLLLIPVNSSFAQVNSENGNVSQIELSLDEILKIFESPQALLEIFSIDFTRDISTIDLFSFSLGMVVYGIFVWHFYRLISRREIVALPLTKYDSDGRKITSIAVYIIKYIIVFPLVITAWFFAYSLFMFFLAPDLKQDFIFLIVISLVVAIRIAAYYKEDLSKDLAKMIPFALLGIFLVNTSLFTLDQLVLRLNNFVPFLGKIAIFVLYAIGVEVALRMLFLIKQKFIPAPDSSVDDEIERSIDARMRIRMEHMEKKQEDMEKKLNEKITKTEDKLETKIEKTEDKLEGKIEKTEYKKSDNGDKSKDSEKVQERDSNIDKEKK